MKKLIAAAVAAAIIAPASVMAAGPTLYGKLHMSIDGLDNNGKGSTNTQYDEWSLQSNSSRIGVKGSEDLGNGMKVGYLIEWEVNMDGNQSSSMKERNRAVTLSGDWGTALAGKWDTPLKTVGRKFDLFGDQIGDTRNLAKNSTNDNRASNVVAYVTPNMNGFSSTIAYVFDRRNGEQKNVGAGQYTDDNSDFNAWSFNALYNNGPIALALGYADYSDDALPSTANSDNATTIRVAGSYAFGDFKVLASYTDFENIGFAKKMDTDMWTLGGSYKMGNNTIKLQYSALDDADRKTCGTAGTSKCKDGADMWSIGLDHAMSKRTTVYAAYATTDNNKDASRVSWGGGHGATATGITDEDADAFSVGIIHKF